MHFVIPALDVVNRSQTPFLNQLYRALKVCARPLLQPDLHDTIGSPRGLEHHASFPDAIRYRLLHIHVLARQAGIDAHQRVPVIGSRNHDRLDTAVLKQFAVIVICRGLAAGHAQSAVEMRPIDIAHGHHFRVRTLLEIDLVGAAHAAAADNSNTDPIGCRCQRRAAGRHQFRRGSGQHALSAKAPAVYDSSSGNSILISSSMM